MREILRRVFLEGKFYTYNCQRWDAYGYRLGQLQYETRFYRDGAVRSRFWGPGISETWGKGGEEMAKRDCCNCAEWPDCPKPINGGDSCEGWRDKKTADAPNWAALQEAIAKKDLNGLLKALNHRYLVGEGR